MVDTPPANSQSALRLSHSSNVQLRFIFLNYMPCEQILTFDKHRFAEHKKTCRH